jgi:hypothetical protein
MISRFESRKDAVQVLTEAAAEHAGRIAVIIAGAVRGVAREVGELATEAFEVGEATRKADADESASAGRPVEELDRPSGEELRRPSGRALDRLSEPDWDQHPGSASVVGDA